jgi:sucrose-6-phosphate hydrolase SacC (GH32 family)
MPSVQVSDDLVNWQQLPMSLTRQNWYDAGGDFSGSATVLNDEAQTPVLTVSSSSNQVVFIAIPEDRSDPYLTNWVSKCPAHFQAHLPNPPKNTHTHTQIHTRTHTK